jgi:hypothetical protein
MAYSKEKKAAYYQRNKERIKQRNRERLLLNKEMHKEKRREWYVKNKASVLKRNQEWVRSNQNHMREYQREYRQRNKGVSRAYHRNRCAENRRAILEIKKRAWCSHCGTHDGDVLQAHHVDRHLKLFEIARAGSRASRSIEAELAKCIWLCANCHMKLTMKRCDRKRVQIGAPIRSQEVQCEIIDMFKREQSS